LECDPKIIKGDEVKPIVEFTDSENLTYLIEAGFMKEVQCDINKLD